MTALVVAATLGTLGLPAVAVQPAESVSYALSADPADPTVCVGGEVYIGVSITRTLTLGGLPQPIVSVRDGGRIGGEDHTPDVARLTDAERTVPRGGQIALFQVQTLKAGTATFFFEIETTGDEALIPYDATMNPIGALAHINVVQCWEAYTSGLGKVWEEKNVCTLERPFLLSGVWPGIAGSEPIFYMPTDPTHGRFVMIDTLQQTWLIAGSGTYEVGFHIGATVEEGNIVMTGTGTMSTVGLTLPVDPLKFEVAIRPMADPTECEGL